MMRRIWPAVGIALAALLSAEDVQKVVGFASIVFAHNSDHLLPSSDYRGPAIGYATAGWWAPGQMKDNRLVWRTAPCPKSAPPRASTPSAHKAAPPKRAPPRRPSSRRIRARRSRLRSASHARSARASE